MFERIKNKLIIDRYPFLLPRMVLTKEPVRHFDYSWTELDEMPFGWKKAFGYKMCEEIRKALIKHCKLNDYMIVQIKEKFGELRWYDDGAPREVHDIIDKYSDLSRVTCIECGKPATKISKGWVSPYCDECAKKFNLECDEIDK